MEQKPNLPIDGIKQTTKNTIKLDTKKIFALNGTRVSDVIEPHN